MIMNYLTTTALAAALFTSPTLALPLSQPRPAAVEYDARRCAVTLSAGDVHVRFSSLYPVEFDAMNAEFKPIGDIARVQIDQTTFALHPGQAFEYRPWFCQGGAAGPGARPAAASIRGRQERARHRHADP